MHCGRLIFSVLSLLEEYLKWESVCVRNNAWLKRSNPRRSWETKKKTKVPEQRKWRCVKTTHKSSGFLLTGSSQTADDIITKEPYKRSSYSLQSQFNSPWMVIGNSRGNQSYCTFFFSPWRLFDRKDHLNIYEPSVLLLTLVWQRASLSEENLEEAKTSL